MLLNFQHQKAIEEQNNTPIVLIHGLFGSLSNLGVIARAFNNTHDVIQVDVRNHGHSSHSPEMNYELMANDILETMDHLNISKFTAIGHSMGGKIAMKLTEVASQQLEQLVILDMAPFSYQENHHDTIFKALFSVKEANINSRKEATEIMRQYINEDMVIQFLLMSFKQGKWLFNVEAIYQHYHDILAWENIAVWEKPTLFIRGDESPYLMKEEYLQAVKQQFAQAEIQSVDGAGHWLHAQKPEQVIENIKQYLSC